MAWAYILRCGDGSYYVGSTVDLERRLGQHQVGEGAAYTRMRLPVELVWCAQFSQIRDAFAFEKRVQNWGRRKREALISGQVELLPDLAGRSWAARQARTGVVRQPVELMSPEERWVPRPAPPVGEDDPWAPPVEPGSRDGS